VAPDAISLNSVIKSLANAGYLREAVNILKRSSQFGCDMASTTYTMLLSLAARSAEHGLVLTIWQSMESCGLRPNRDGISACLESLVAQVCGLACAQGT
jgi:pentatricopeptide repeat protein